MTRWFHFERCKANVCKCDVTARWENLACNKKMLMEGFHLNAVKYRKVLSTEDKENYFHCTKHSQFVSCFTWDSVRDWKQFKKSATVWNFPSTPLYSFVQSDCIHFKVQNALGPSIQKTHASCNPFIKVDYFHLFFSLSPQFLFCANKSCN